MLVAAFVPADSLFDLLKDAAPPRNVCAKRRALGSHFGCRCTLVALENALSSVDSVVFRAKKTKE
jgi:hypothetical protein